MKQDLMNKELQKNDPNMGFGRHSARFANRSKPKDISKTLKRLLHYTQGQKLKLLLVLMVVILMAILNLIAPRLLGLIVDALYALVNQTSQSINWSIRQLIIILMVTYVGVSVFSFVSEFLIASTSQKIVEKLRNILFDKLGQLPISYFDTHAHGDIMSRFTNDIDNVSTVLSTSTTSFLNSIITVFGALGIMLFLNPVMALGVLVSVPLIFGLSQLIARHTIEYYKKQQFYTGQLNGLIEETVYGLSIIQGYNKEVDFDKQFGEVNETLTEYSSKAQIWTGLLMPLMNVINNLTFAVVGLLGGYLVLKGIISVGIVASFIAYSRQFVRPLNEMASIYNTLMSAIAGASRVFEILDELEEVENVENDDHFKVEGHIAFENVSFSYVEGIEVIKDLNMTVHPGMKVAIVGPTGAGKTTIVNLVTRFYDVTKGDIKIDGRSIRDINRHALRQNVGFVLQDTYLFSGTIMDNIRYGKLEASEEAIKKAAKLAMAHDFIKKLPQGYETQLNYGGTNLSQGERQLVTIARAILSNPSILILDEATSSVDIVTEKLISKSMTELMANRTSFIIAHRLSTIVEADLILVLNEGRLIEHGNHKSLMAQDGFYAQMVKLQTQ